MKQVLQNLRSGHIEIADVPCPMVKPGHLLIQSRASLISAGTERMLVEFSKGSLLAKARSQPERVKQVLDKIKAEGLLPTLEAVFARLDEPMPLGYCNAGVVVEVGAGVSEFKTGDRVAGNGAHAEMVCVPKNLCVKIPEDVEDVEAAFTVLASIGLQGIRLLAPTLGETIVVTGLGLIGLISVQLLVNSGCCVLGIDPDRRRCELARQFGAEVFELADGADPLAAAQAFTSNRGVDGVLITASSKDSGIVKQAAQMCRKRGRIILVGVVGLELNRSDFYKKELSFQVSCSYGPGRYDSNYEEKGQDYPLPYVRWTQQRNFEAIVEMLASHRLDIRPLITSTIQHTDATQAYEILSERRDALGIILTYPHTAAPCSRVVALAGPRTATAAAGQVVIGLIGAGNFARMTLLPALKGSSARLRTIVSAGGVSGVHAGRKFGFEQAATDYRKVLDDNSINLVIITTRHDLHAKMTLEAIHAGKHVAVEKPLCLNTDELRAIQQEFTKHPGRQLLVGFNRRFSPHAIKMKQLLAGRSQPLCMTTLINAGAVGDESWVHDAATGGGRIIGEGCHWIDLMSFLAGSPIVRVMSTQMGQSGIRIDDKCTITLTFADGSIGTLHYFANGSKEFPKESMDVFCENRVLRLENFRLLRGFGWPGFTKMKLLRMDKGHREEFRRLNDAIVSGGEPVMPFDQIENVMLATFAAAESARKGQPIDLPC
jgi:predicted dehydrogenase/threonine dehydrogenase-like Zn-dependent dehydrogenase